MQSYNPLTNPGVAQIYNSLLRNQGHEAAQRYLATVTPKDGLRQQAPRVVTQSRRKDQKPKPAARLSEPLPSSRTLAGSDVLVNASVTESESDPPPEPATETPVAAVVTETPPVEATRPNVPVSLASPEQSKTAVTPTSTSVETVAAESPVTAVADETAKPARKPARSTAEVKQAFEDALAAFVKAGKPFKRTHVLQKAGLGAGFYNTYPSLKTKVDVAIANLGKPQTQVQAEEPMNRKPVAAVETPAQAPTQPSPQQEAEAATPMPTPAALSPEPSQTGQLATQSETTAVTHTHSPVGGLAWTELEGLAVHWRNEQARLKQQISSLLQDLDTAVENAEAYERVLQLHSTETPGGDA